MHNFRGFDETLVPLMTTNFLVGENSTGKSSFLSLLRVMSDPAFQFYARFPLPDELELGGFHDIVSAWSAEKNSFRVGHVDVTRKDDGRHSLEFAVHTFVDGGGTPRLSRYSQLRRGVVSTLLFDRKRTRYRTEESLLTFGDEESACKEFCAMVQSECTATAGFKSFPRDVPPDPPLPIALSIMQSLSKTGRWKSAGMDAEILALNAVTWIAPIRTKPMRIYDSMRRGYSPEGEHAPVLLRRTLSSRTRSQAVADRLKEFGQASGLFETVTTHSFGNGSQNPFEILVKFEGAELNISNVGYGVSQVLPLIVEFLTSSSGEVFAVQQPEVHLHPRAQAALGDLLFELAKDGENSIYVETHSDYLIDRYRLAMRDDKNPPDSQVVFFKRTCNGNVAVSLEIGSDGQYPGNQPTEFRDFFVREEIKLLDV